MSTTHFETELREQPETLRRLLREGAGAARAAAALLDRRRPRFAVIAARGTSDNAARYAQYLLGIRNDLVAALATPSVFSHYGARPSLEGSLVIGISQSGESPDIVGVVEEGRRQGATTLAVTNEPASPLARAAELVLPLLAGTEQAVAATKTYGAQLGTLAMLSAALRDEGDAWRELEALPERLEECLERNARCAEAAARFRDATRLVVVGRGYNLSTAMEITLKVKETSGIVADGYSSADFLHGPKAILDSSFPVLAVAPGPRVFEDLEETVRLAAGKAAPLAVISERGELLEAAQLAMPLPPGIPEWLSPLAAIIPGQLFALGLSVARGLQPDTPAGLTKVTHTR